MENYLRLICKVQISLNNFKCTQNDSQIYSNAHTKEKSQIYFCISRFFYSFVDLFLFVDGSTFGCGFVRLPGRGWIRKCVANQMSPSFSTNHISASPPSNSLPMRLPVLRSHNLQRRQVRGQQTITFKIKFKIQQNTTMMQHMNMCACICESLCVYLQLLRLI